MIEPIAAKHSPVRLILWLIILVVLLALVSAIAWSFSRKMTPVPVVESRAASDRPAYTPEVAAKLRVSTGFDALVSYTGTSFEPASLTISRGQTIRITNNSSHSLTLTIGTDTDTETVASRDFFERTFETAGTFDFSDGGGGMGIVVVQ